MPAPLTLNRCAAAGGAVRIRFVASRRFVHVDGAGRLSASRKECPAQDVACTFDRLRTERPGFFALRSRLTGQL